MVRSYKDAPRNPKNDARDKEASRFYNMYYRNDMYKIAINGKSTRYANQLIDAALERCGSPYFTAGKVRFGPAARHFLDQFPNLQGKRSLGDGKITLHTDLVARTYCIEYHCDPIVANLMYRCYAALEENMLRLRGFRPALLSEMYI